MTNTQRKKGVVTFVDQRNIIIDELAKAIAEMFDSGETEDVLHKLYEAISLAKYALLHSDANHLKSELKSESRKLHAALEKTQELVEAEDPSEMIAERERQLQERHKKLYAGIMVAKNMRSASYSDIDNWLDTAEEWIAELNEIESITTMTNYAEQCEAYADYYTKKRIKAIIGYWEGIAVGTGGTLEIQDIQHIIKVNYLNGAFHREMVNLAQILGRDDIIEKAETPIDRIARLKNWIF